MRLLEAEKELEKQGYRTVPSLTPTGQVPLFLCVIDRGQASSGGHRVLDPALMASEDEDESETTDTVLFAEVFDHLAYPPLETEVFIPTNLISDRWSDRGVRKADLNTGIQRAFSHAILLMPVFYNIRNPNDVETLLPRFYKNPITRQLLQFLEQSPSHLRNDTFEGITRICSVDEILDESLALFDETHREIFLIQAVALLETFHKFAWPALKRLIRLRRLETELFVPLIASCDGIPAEIRAESLRDLAISPHAEIRSAIFDQLSEFDETNVRPILEVLSQDEDDGIRDEATEYLNDLN